MAKKILMLVGDFAEDYEVMVPFQALLAVGHTVRFRVDSFTARDVTNGTPRNGSRCGADSSTSRGGGI